MTKIVIHSDGSKTAGAAVAYDLAGVKLAERARVVVDGTVPICEYTGLIVGMRLARDLGATEVECWMDAELVARHATGEYACRDAKLKPYLAQVRALQAEFEATEVRLFPKAGPRMKRRHMNVEADALAAECSRLGRNIDRMSADAPGRFFSSRFQRVLDQRSWEAMMSASNGPRPEKIHANEVELMTEHEAEKMEEVRPDAHGVTLETISMAWEGDDG